MKRLNKTRVISRLAAGCLCLAVGYIIGNHGHNDNALPETTVCYNFEDAIALASSNNYSERRLARCLLQQNGRLWQSEIRQCMDAYQPETLVKAMDAMQRTIDIGDFTDPVVIKRWKKRHALVTKAMAQFYRFGACAITTMGNSPTISYDKELSPAANAAVILYMVFESDRPFITDVPFMGTYYDTVPPIVGELVYRKPDRIDPASPLLKRAMKAMLQDERDAVRCAANRLLTRTLWQRDWVGELYKEMLVSDKYKRQLSETIQSLEGLKRLPLDEARSFLHGIPYSRFREILERKDISEARKDIVRGWFKIKSTSNRSSGRKKTAPLWK